MGWKRGVCLGWDLAESKSRFIRIPKLVLMGIKNAGGTASFAART